MKLDYFIAQPRVKENAASFNHQRSFDIYPFFGVMIDYILCAYTVNLLSLVVLLVMTLLTSDELLVEVYPWSRNNL